MAIGVGQDDNAIGFVNLAFDGTNGFALIQAPGRFSLAVVNHANIDLETLDGECFTEILEKKITIEWIGVD